jgi:hypothetical protein
MPVVILRSARKMHLSIPASRPQLGSTAVQLQPVQRAYHMIFFQALTGFRSCRAVGAAHRGWDAPSNAQRKVRHLDEPIARVLYL